MQCHVHAPCTRLNQGSVKDYTLTHRDIVWLTKRQLCIILGFGEGDTQFGGIPRTGQKFAYVMTHDGKTGWVYAGHLKPGLPRKRRPKKANEAKKL